MATEHLTVTFGGSPALSGISLAIERGGLTAVIGPSGCGKSTLLRTWNRTNDRVSGMRLDGRALFLDHDVYARDVDPTELRRRVGMVFQRPVVFPMSIFENVAYGRRVHRMDAGPAALAEHVERCLRRSGLWDEVKDRLRERASVLSGGQQQRLAIARALAVEPEVILLDEPTSAVDPVGTAKIEDTLRGLGDWVTLVLVTHNLQQAARLSRRVAFLEAGRLVEEGPTEAVFQQPSQARTEEYLTGRSA